MVKIIKIRSCMECPNIILDNTTLGAHRCKPLLYKYAASEDKEDFDKSEIRTGSPLQGCPLDDYEK